MNAHVVQSTSTLATLQTQISPTLGRPVTEVKFYSDGMFVGVVRWEHQRDIEDLARALSFEASKHSILARNGRPL